MNCTVPGSSLAGVGLYIVGRGDNVSHFCCLFCLSVIVRWVVYRLDHRSVDRRRLIQYQIVSFWGRNLKEHWLYSIMHCFFPKWITPFILSKLLQTWTIQLILYWRGGGLFLNKRIYDISSSWLWGFFVVFSSYSYLHIWQEYL